MNYWLAKTEPGTYSWHDLKNEPDKSTCWEGIRNYRVRNLIRDEIKLGDLVFIYHSVVKPMAIAGVARVIKEAYTDHFAFDPGHKYFDPKSKKDDPAWLMFDIMAYQDFDKEITLYELKTFPELENMALLKKGNRMSVQKVTAEEWKFILGLRKVKNI